MIKVVESFVDKIENKIDLCLEPIISVKNYDLEYDMSKQGFLMYINKGISPKTILDKMLNSEMSSMFIINMDKSNPRTILIKLKR